MSDTEPGEYKQNSRSPDIKDEVLSSRSRSRSRKSASLRRSYSGSRSRSRSRSYRSRSRSRRRSYRSRTPDRHTNGRYKRYSRSRSRSRSRSYHKRERDSRSPMSGRKRHIGDRLNPPTGKCLGVFGLSLYTTESDIRGVFNRYGNITNINIVIDQKTGRSRGFGFVYFDDDQDAADAKERANGMELDGRRIRVDFSITKRAHTPTPGVYVGRPAAPADRDRDRYSDRYDRDRHDRHDRYDRGGDRDRDRDRYRDDYYRRDSYRRSPSPYQSRRRSPSPYHRESYRERSPYRSRY